ncbi:hypothetical protein [Anthropogastromicrobium sp.]|uniref:hypothetical protein n=1 Tax=Anthropogastromicrobium sp. TaxID=2981649 RepID=UPI003078DBF4
MQFGEQQLEAYLIAYNKFQADMSVVEDLEESLHNMQENLKNKQQQLEQSIRDRNFTEKQKQEAEKKARRLEYQYSRSMGTNDITGGNDYVILNEYTDPDIFEKKQKEIKQQCDESIRVYCEKKEAELTVSKGQLLQEQSEYNQDKNNYIRRTMKQINSDCLDIIEKKKQDVLEYLNANQKIKSTETAKRIQNVVDTETIGRDECGSSEENIITRILLLKGTEDYCRTQRFDREDFNDNRRKLFSDGIVDFVTQYKKGSYYQSKLFYPFLGIMIIGLFILFTIGIAPWTSLIPSSRAIASVGGTAVTWIIRTLVSAIIAVVVGGIVYWVVEEVIIDDGGAPGVIVGIIAFVVAMFLFDTFEYLKFSTQSMMGAGVVLHYIILEIFNFIVITVIVAVMYLVIVHTALVKIFFKPGKDMVIEDLNHFEEYFDRNRVTYVQMFHYEEAIGYACENRLHSKIMELDAQLQNMEVDSECIAFTRECNEKLDARQRERSRQIAEIEQQKNASEEKKNTLSKKLKEKDKEILELQGVIDFFTDKINLLISKITKQKTQMEDTKNSLIKQTKILTDDSVDTFDAECKLLNTPGELLKCKGQLAKHIYFVRNEKDKNEMAELRKIDLRCQHTIFVYDDKDISGNNLSEELCHFIKWFIDAVRRSNPETLLRKFPVIDVLSGISILSMPPYNRYIQVITNEDGKAKLVGALEEKENDIVSDIRKKGVRINSFDELNNIKMGNDRNIKDIAIRPNIPIDELWEKPRPYSFIIFIVPNVNEDGGKPSVLSDQIKNVLMNVKLYGIVPIFLISSNTWNNVKESADAAYLQNVKDKTVFLVKGVGRDNASKLDI